MANCTTCGIASASCDLVHVEPEHLCCKCAEKEIKNMLMSLMGEKEETKTIKLLCDYVRADNN